jgi:hypothetical protein
LEDENIQEMAEGNRDNMLPLLQQIPGCEKVNDDCVQQWMKKSKQKELTDHDVIALVNLVDGKDGEDNDTGTGLVLDETKRISHCKGVKPLEAVLAYIKQQGETTDCDISFRLWCDLAAKKGKAEKQTSITHFVK